jgi:CBS domain containing-hemolysin-like protein
MLVILGIAGLAGLTLLSLSLQKTYAHVPPKELKRRARDGDAAARALYNAAVYGASLRAVLWLLIGLAGAAFFVMLASTAGSRQVALIGSAALIWLGFLWLPRSKVSGLGTNLATGLTPVLTWILQYIHPAVDRIGHFIRRHRPAGSHTGLYHKEDLIALIQAQRAQADSRIAEEELELAARALEFGDKLIRDHMTPRRVVKTVVATDTIGPILMGELHDSGFSRFPVYQDNPDHIVGTLHLRDVIDRSGGGRIKDVMSKQVCYVHEERSLRDALRAFLKTRHHLFIVVNSFEEFVGILTIEDVLEQVIGKPIIDEFDRYEDMRAVAARAAQKDHQRHTQRHAHPN